MSANDVYRIEERTDGLFDVYHDDADSLPRIRGRVAKALALKDATSWCGKFPAEYGYYIAWLDDQDYSEEKKGELDALESKQKLEDQEKAKARYFAYLADRYGQ